MTKTQFKALWAAFKKNSAWYGRTGGAMGGAYRRMCQRMATEGLVSASAPYPITRKGMIALRDACRTRYAKSGCMAYLDDLRDVENALKSALERIEERGLSVIRWFMEKDAIDGRDIVQYAISIDGRDEPSEEQKQFCNWSSSPERAAQRYITDNPDHFNA